MLFRFHSVAAFWILVGTLLLASSARGQEAKAEESKPEESKPTKAETPNPFTLTVTGDIDTESADVVGRLTTLFYHSYPKLVTRFGNPNSPPPLQVKLIFKKKLNVPAYCTGSEISISLEWLKQHPDDIALLTHELTHVVQAYKRGRPGWFVEGLADYARHLYGPEVQPGWELPKRLTSRHKYTDSYRVTGKFFLWLDEKHPGVIDKLHHQMQEGDFRVDNFKILTGKTVDELWAECVEEMAKKEEQKAAAVKPD